MSGLSTKRAIATAGVSGAQQSGHRGTCGSSIALADQLEVGLATRAGVVCSGHPRVAKYAAGDASVMVGAGDKPMSAESSLDVMNRELRAASPDLVGNGDLLRGVLSGCGDCIKVLDLDGRLLFISDGGKRVMEVEDFSALKGCPWPEFWVGDGNVQAITAVEAAKAGKTARFRSAANTAKGTPRYWDVQVSPIFGAHGQISQLLSISRDITEEWGGGGT
jgi:PAS domain-containing protein